MIDPVTLAEDYIKALLWSSTVTPPGSNELTPVDEDELIPCQRWVASPEFVQKATSELEEFLSTLPSEFDPAEACLVHGHDPHTMLAHDFALTRNRHGAGFWDGDWAEPWGKILTDFAHQWPETELYLSDNCLVEQK